MHHRVKGIVIRETDKGETSKLLTVLTSDRGVITVYAKGVRKYQSPNMKVTQLFVYSEMIVYNKNDYFILMEGTPINNFYALRNDIVDYSLACYLCEAAASFAVKGDDSDSILRTLLNSLYAIENKLSVHCQIKASFELRICAESGFFPDISECESCGKSLSDTDFYFYVYDGVSYCTDCHSSDRASVKIIRSVGMAMRHIITSPLARFLSFRISDSDLNELSSVCERYFLFCADRGFKTLSFYKQCEELQ